jgi:CBS domain-containing protein
MTPTISEFMTPDPCGIDENLSLADAIDRMLANNIRHLIVLRDGELLGLIDSGDLTLAQEASDDSAKDVPVAKAVRGVFRCTPDASAADVVRTMERNHFGCAVAVDDAGVAVGIFTITDALRGLRRMLLGHEVPAEVTSTHHPDLPQEREKTLPRVRVKRMLRRAHAAPAASDGMAFGKVGV